MRSPVAVFGLVVLAACGGARAPAPRLDEQTPLVLAYCMRDPAATPSLDEAQRKIAERVTQEGGAVRRSGDAIVVELPGGGNDGDPQQAAAALTETLRGGDLPELVPCADPAASRRGE